MALRQYATIAQFEESPLTSGTTTDQALVAASLDIDRLLLTAVYDVDAAGLPTNPDVAETLRDATIAQAQYARTLGDAAGIGAGRITQGTIGSVSITRSGTPSGEGAPTRNSPQAWQILHSAGLVDQPPWSC